jgi:hypothetical protein
MTWLIKSPNKFLRLSGIIAVLIAMSACTQIRYVDHTNSKRMEKQTEDPSTFSRKVDFHLANAFYETPPNCVMILPINLKGINKSTAHMVEDAVSRHATNRFDKTITSRHVKFAARKRALDPTHLGDRKRLGRLLRCDAQLEIKTVGVENFYALVWADLSVALQLTLVRSRDHALLWRGKHKARRADGGLPLTLIGAGARMFAAGKLAGDTDVLPSMIDDAVRRVMVSLPDMRVY